MIKRILVALLLLSSTAAADTLPPLQLYCAGSKVGTKFKWNVVGATCAASGTVTGAYDVTTAGGGLTGVSSPLGGLGTLVSPLTCATCATTAADLTFTTGAARIIKLGQSATTGWSFSVLGSDAADTGDLVGGSLTVKAGRGSIHGTGAGGQAGGVGYFEGGDGGTGPGAAAYFRGGKGGSPGMGSLGVMGAGGHSYFYGGDAGGAGNSNGGNAYLDGGLLANAGAPGQVSIGATQALVLSIGRAASTTTGLGIWALPTTLTIGGSATIGDMPYWSAAGTVSRLAGGAAGTRLKGNGAGVAPSYTTSTFVDAYTTGDILHATGANTVGVLADVAVGQVHVSGGVGAISSYTGSPLLYTNSIGVGTGHAGAGVTLENTTAATNVMEQHSPALELSGETWNGAVTKKNSWWIQNRPYTGNTPGNLFFSQNDYAGGTTAYDVMRIQRSGVAYTYVVGVNTSLILAGGNSATGITVNTNGLTSPNILAATDHAGTIGGVANRFIRAPYVMGTAIATTDVALGAGWAASGNAPSAVTGDDSAGTMTWTNGTVGAGLTVTLTFKATWGTSAVPFCTMKTASTTDTVPGNWDQTAVSATATTWTYDRAPTTGATWKVAYVCHFGR